MVTTTDTVRTRRGGAGRTYSDVEYVQGLLDNPQVQYALYRHWESYFNDHAGNEFFHLDQYRRDIVHNAYEVLWEKVRAGKIRVENGILTGNDGKPFKGTLTTYLMSVARINNLELWRGDTKTLSLEDLKPKGKVDCDDDGINVESVLPSEPIEESPFLTPSADLAMREIVAGLIANMSERCSQILTMFYYREMKLDSILVELTSFKSKDALKTAKNKCMDRLKIAACKQYKEYLNS